MFTFEFSISVNRQQQEVFDFVSNPANDAQWQSSNISNELTSEGSVGVGSTMRSVDKLLGRKVESTTEVTVWDPPNQYAIKSIGGPFPFEITMTLESKEEGTQLTASGQAEFGGFFKLTEGLVGKQLEKQFTNDFDALKMMLEAG